MAGGLLSTGYLGLGSNLGERRAHLQAAVRELSRRGVEPLASSSVYETEPVGLVLDQPWFYNACIRIGFDRDPEELLDACKATERAVGRAAGGMRHGPRVIDVDLLVLGETAYESERLVLPHPSILERRFVLLPLLELEARPEWTRALAGLDESDQQVRPAGPPLEV